MSTRISDGQPRALEPIALSELEAYFQRATKTPDRWRIGAEYEKIAVLRESGQQLPYDGPDGIEEILTRLAARFGWRSFDEAGRIMALLRDGATVTLEPGGQLELSSAQCQDIFGLEAELLRHREELRAVVDPDRVAWLAVGLTPFSRVEDIALMPKARYRIMDHYLPLRSPYARHMMRGTASIQTSLDYSDEEDAVRKFLVAISLSPIVNALFANSPVYAGQLTGDVSFRGRIWSRMDPDRSGFLADVARIDDFSFQRWVDYLLDAPMMFYCIDDVFSPANGRTFRDFMEKGLEGYFPTLEDWEMHQTSIFPEVRLKKYIEVRGADCVRPALALAVSAIWKGLFYDRQALDGALEAAREIPAHERAEISRIAFTEGLSGVYRGRTLLVRATELVALASDGLRRQAEASGGRDERPFLDPVWELLRGRCSPGTMLATAWPSIGHDPAAVARFLEY